MNGHSRKQWQEVSCRSQLGGTLMKRGQKYHTEPSTGHAKEVGFSPNKKEHYRALKY